jgi:hypothetical protein
LKSIIKIIGTEESKNIGRDVELTIEDCSLTKDIISNSDISRGFIRTEPLTTAHIKISFIDIIADSI